MAYDLLITNGTIVDGTGAARFKGDVAVKDGKIAALGKAAGPASTVIDAAGKVVSPGFVDPHTHYDAQITWDRVLSSSAEHGVTTVVMGNCGVGLAPCRPAEREWLADDLVTVEGIDKEVLTEGIQWEWETYPQYFDAAEKRGSALNLAFLAPITPFRTFVLGAEANERAATPEETKKIAALLDEAMSAGAWGITTTANRQHIGHGGKPLAARLASREELAAYGGVLKRLKRGVMELALTKRYATLAEDEEDLLKFLLDSSDRPVTWLSLSNLIEKPGASMAILDHVEPLHRRGAMPQIMTRPMVFDMNLRRPFMLTEMTSAKPLFDTTFEKQMAFYADPAFRKAFKEELKTQSRKWGAVVAPTTVVSVVNPELKHYEGRTVGEIAQERGQDPNDAFFDIAVADSLQVKFVVPRANTDPAQLADMMRDPRALIGLSDAGAHLDMLCEFGYTTYMLGHWVREKRVLSLERAIQRITSEPADFFGLDRGRLKAGAPADIVVFDAETINSPSRSTAVKDLPGGGTRLYCKAEGISRVIVGGQEIYRDGRPTGALPGKVLRAA